MRRLGVIVLVLGLAGFVIASSKRGSYDSVQGALKAAISSEEKGKKDFWEAARWVSLGAVGLALLVVGVTWEARRRNLETAGRYLAELR